MAKDPRAVHTHVVSVPPAASARESFYGSTGGTRLQPISMHSLIGAKRGRCEALTPKAAKNWCEYEWSGIVRTSASVVL